MFELKLKGVDGATHQVQASGRITQHAIAENGNAFIDTFGNDIYSKRVILGFENVEHVDSSGVGWLLSNNKQFGQNGGKLVLHSLPPAVKNVFGMLNLNRVISLAGSEEEAKQAVEEKGDGND
jgi:anti-anti-sigma factor